MGSVYRARERTSGREVALKILHAQTASAASRFVREGQVTAQLQHPGIVRIHSIGTFAGKPCLAYELVPGARSFESAVEDDPSLAIPLLVQAGQALGAAHAAGLTHRDVKSENLLVDTGGRLRVSDFGLVTGEELSRLTQTGAWVGTPQTMAPEQFGSRRPAGPPCDVWALGVLLFWSLTRRYPFDAAQNMIQLATSITKGDFPRPSTLAPVPRPLEAVCLKALSTRPEDRYANGTEFADALQAALGAEPSSRSGVALLVISGALAAITLGLALGLVLTPSEERSPRALTSATTRVTPLVSPSAPHALATPSKAPDRVDLEAILSWKPRKERAPLDPAILNRPYRVTEGSFRHLLDAMKVDWGPETQLRAARALLTGIGVERDIDAALAILRHGAEEDRRGTMVLLIETLASEGKRKEELIWIGRMTIHNPSPFELHRLWRIARSREPRAKLAGQVLAALSGGARRWPVVHWFQGTKNSRNSNLRAEGEEKTQFIIENIVAGWQLDEKLESDWHLGVVLDAIPPEDRERLIAYASPSRRLARLCFRRQEKALLEGAIEPTLTGAGDGWLLEVLRGLRKLKAHPPCLEGILSRLRHSEDPNARRWIAACEAEGFGVRQSQRGLETLQKLARGGDHEAGVLLANGVPRGADPRQVEALLRYGVAADHPGSLLTWGLSLLHGRNSSEAQRSAGLEFLKRAAEGGDASAKISLAGLLQMRIASRKDLKKSHDLLASAAAQDRAYALERLGNLQRMSVGCSRDRAAGKRNLRRAAWLGNASAAETLGELLMKPEPDETPGEGAERWGLARLYLRQAVVQRGSASARVALAEHALAEPERAEEGYQTLVEMTKATPAGDAATALGRLLLKRGQKAEGERVLRRAALQRSAALASLLKHLRDTGRAKEAETLIEEGLRAKRPPALFVAARERYGADRRWAQETLQSLGKQEPEASAVLGTLLWSTKHPQNHRAAWRYWVKAEARGSVSARDELIKHDPPPE